SILCETNASPTLITDLQRALNAAGYEAGPVDGVLGKSTMNAVNAYQRANGLSSGQLTIETLKKLGVDV
ncbi:MAG: peptidoglycan-binding protein, partial [Gammaproteobacteria bacterium]|nr:peptidoglycan-binding protein [Gammaproteobacteria bacterium]